MKTRRDRKEGKMAKGNAYPLQEDRSTGLQVLFFSRAQGKWGFLALLGLPALGFGVVSGSFLMMLMTLALGLVFSRDPNPDADGF
jgi:hypothetical protein